MDRTFALPGSAGRPLRAQGGYRHRVAALAPAVTLALLAACGTTPRAPPGNVSHLPPGNSQRDGPEANPPPDLWEVPDAVPQIEPVRIGGPNKPYEVDGHTYVPITDDRAVIERGLASWYGKKFHGHRTSSGEAYNMYAMTAAHKTLPIPSYARVRNPANGREVIVRVNDRGPFASGRIIDLSYTAALKLGVLGGVQPVEVERITDEDIRTGAAFQRGGTRFAAAAPPAPAPAATATTTTVVTTTVAALPPGTVGLTPVPVAGAPWPRAGASSVAVDTSPGMTSRASGAAAGTVVAKDPGASSGVTASTPVAASGQVASIGVASNAPVALPASATASSGAMPMTSVALSGTTMDPPRDAPASGLTPGVPASSSSSNFPGEAVASSGVGLQPGAAPTSGPMPVAGASSAVLAATAPRVAAAPALPPLREESVRAETPGGAGYWVQIGAYRQRNGALDFQHRLIDEQPWLAPLLAVFTENGLNRLQAGPYGTREDARFAAERIRIALQLVPTIVEKR
jgi:rare lipoprotein A